MILKLYYKLSHPGVQDQDIPYWYKRSIFGELWHLIRKGICQNIAPNCVLTPVRIALYRLCGFRIGKGCFIGMKCYFDDLCVDKMEIGNNVTISYGVYFACHGPKQEHNRLEIKNGAYIGMRASIVARQNMEIGENAVIGAMSLVNKSIPSDSIAVGVPCKVKNKMSKEYRSYKGTWIFAHDPHKEQKITNEQKEALFDMGGVMIRNSYDFDCKEETSFWYVIKDSFGGMEELSSKMRNQVKKCFKTMKVEPITGERLLNDGYDIYVAAANSYMIKATSPTRDKFQERIKESSENEYWGCFDNETGKLVAFCMNAVTDESCEYRTMKALPEYQKKYAYYGLIYEMNRYYLEERKVMYVNDGARSITNHSNIQPFLIEKFNFRKAYCHFEITYRWWFGLMVKALYPFRKYITHAKVQAILNMESMARGEL